MKKTLLLIALFSLQLSYSQNWYNQIDMDPYNVYDGIGNEPSDAIYDDNGALWTSYKIGSVNGAVSKYYNNTYTYYSIDSANFPAKDIRDLCIENGIIYAATDTGIVKFNGTNWSIFLDSISGLNSYYVYGLDIKNNKLYARTDSVLNIYDISAGTFTYVQLPTNYNNWISTDVKRAVFVDDNETVYLGDTNSVYVINNALISSVYHTDFQYGADYINDIKFTASGTMFALSSSYIYKLSGNNLININTSFSSVNQFSYTYSNNILIDVDTVYAITWGNTIVKFTVNSVIDTYSKQYNASDARFLGILFKNQSNEICIKQELDIYSIFNFENYINVVSNTDDNTDSLDINYVNASVGQNGRTFNINGQPAYEVPAGSGKHSLYTASLWVSGEDDYTQIHLAGATYNSDGFDYYPGPLDNNGETDSITSSDYNKVWKINRIDIEEMIYRHDNGLLSQAGYQIPEDILDWPANGNTSLGYAQNLAPYFDANSDNVYNIYDGDYPIIKGDQEIFSICNDQLGEHNETGGVPLGIEIHRSFYAYSCSVATDSTDEINYTTFLHYKIINRSNRTYSNTRLGFFIDADIGEGTNDLIGNNVDLKSVYAYNKGADGDGTLNTYGANPPAIGITFLKGPAADNADWKDNDNDGQIDEVGETCDFNNSMYFDRILGVQQSDPTVAIDYWNYMKSIWKDGSHLTYGGNGFNSGANARFAFSGDSDSNFYGTNGIDPDSAWYNTQIGDKRTITSMGPFTFEPGEEVEFELAIVWSRDTTDLVDSNNVQKLFRDIENVRYWYDNQINLSCLEFDSASIGISQINTNYDLYIYPNPVNNVLYLEFPEYNNAKYRITDINGKVLIENKIINARTSINTKDFTKGVYIITIYKNDAVISRKFVK